MKLSDIFHQNQILINKLFPESLRETEELLNRYKPLIDPFGNEYQKVVSNKSTRYYSLLFQQFGISPVAEFPTSAIAPISTSPLNPYFNFTDFYFKEFDFSVLAKEKAKKEESKEIIKIQFDESENIKRIIKAVCHDNEILYSITPRQFEEMTAEILRSHGFHVELSKQTRDGGYDMLAIRSVNNHQDIRYLVQCKRYAAHKRIGVDVIRSFKDVINVEQANVGIIVTTCHFSKDARLKKEKEVPHVLELKDKNDVIEWVNEYKFS